MSNIPLSSLPLAIALDGSEEVPIVQGGTTKRTTTGTIAGLANTGSGGLGAFVTAVDQHTTFPNARLLAAQPGVTTVTDGGAGGSITIGIGTIPLANGGTSANLTASNGGIFYSTASAGAVLAGTATARQVLLSGASTTPAWSTAAYPATTAINQLLYSSAANTIAGLATANSSILVTSAGGVPSFSTTLPAFTLGGNITGAGNSVSGLTTLSATNHTSAGALAFQSNGSTFAGGITTGQQWFIGSTNNAPPTGPQLVISKNISALPPLGTPQGVAGTAQLSLIVGGSDTAANDVILQSFGNFANGVRYFAYGGTAAAPLVYSGGASATLGANFAYVYDGTINHASSGFIFTNTEATVTSAHTGGRIDLFGTATGTTGIAIGASVQAGFMVGDQVDPGAGNATATGSIKSKGPTSGIGYATGAGGAVTQATSRATGVTLNTVSGAITLVSAAGSATPATFTVTDSAVAATDVVHACQKSGADKYEIFVTAVAAGSFNITFFTTGGTTTEQPVFNFVVIKGVAS